jgi:MFS family permease
MDLSMTESQDSKAAGAVAASGPWYRGLTGYHWFVLVVCSLGWAFDTMDQQLFILARAPAMAELLGQTVAKEDIKFYSGLATTIFMFGWATGGIIFGMLGDRWGRAKTMFSAILVYSAFTGLSALSATWWDFSAYRFLAGMGVGGEFAAGVSLVAEVMPARARPYALGALQALSAVGNVTAALISLNLPPGEQMHGVSGWRLMFLVGIVPALLVVLAMRRLKEPESWVRAKEGIARGPARGGAAPALGSLRELFGDRRWRRNVLVGITMALAGIMGLWGIGFWMPELVRDVVPADGSRGSPDWYVSWAMLLQNSGAFVGIYVFSVVTGIVGRRPAFALSFAIGLATVIGVFGFMSQPGQIWWMAPMLGFATLTVFGGYSIYFPELFPTRLRATGTGFCYNTARYLAAAAPFTLGALASMFAAPPGSERAAAGVSKFSFLSSLGGADEPIRYAAIVVASVFLLGLVVLPFAPETKGKPLPE